MVTLFSLGLVARACNLSFGGQDLAGLGLLVD